MLIKFLRKIKNEKLLNVNIFSYNFSIVKKLNQYISARRLIIYNGIIFSITKLTFLSYSFRPKNSDDIKTHTLDSSKFKKYCIVVQGPIIHKDNFTFETIKLYKKFYPTSLIILSTWSDTSENIVSKFNELGIKVILNAKPSSPGWSNVNYQMFSVYSAIQFAKKNNIEYVAKTRTDCRIYSNNFLLYCSSLLEQYPSAENNLSRIISTDYSSKHIIYGLDDKFQFGLLKEMDIFWSYKPWEEELNELFDGNKIINYTPVVCEFFLTARYLKFIKKYNDWTLTSWWDSLKDFFIIIDSSSIDLFFYKYDYYFEQRGNRAYGSEYAKSISHVDWLLLYLNKIKDWKFKNQDTLIKWEITKSGRIRKLRAR